MKRCKYCEQIIPQEFFDKKARQKSQAIRRTIEERRLRGEVIGRPSEVSADEIVRLRKQGSTIREIAKKLHCSTKTVQRAIK